MPTYKEQRKALKKEGGIVSFVSHDSLCSAADLLHQTSKLSRHSRVRLPFLAALDVLLTFARPVTAAISTDPGSPYRQEARDGHQGAEDSDIEDCPTIAEQLTSQTLGELNTAIGAVRNFSSEMNARCISSHPARCSIL